LHRALGYRNAPAAATSHGAGYEPSRRVYDGVTAASFVMGARALSLSLRAFAGGARTVVRRELPSLAHAARRRHACGGDLAFTTRVTIQVAARGVTDA